jgi:hypothetical protein
MVVKTESTTDEVLQSGQKIQLHGRAELKIRRPDRLVADVVSDRKNYAFRQRDVDWQIWIQRGDEPLPRKLVITTTQETSQPQHVVLLTWELNPLLEDGLFAFHPPREAQAIELRTLDARAIPRLTRRAP